MEHAREAHLQGSKDGEEEVTNRPFTPLKLHPRARKPFPMERRWNATLPLGMKGQHDYLEASAQPGEVDDDYRMPAATQDGAVRVLPTKDKPLEGSWVETPLCEHQSTTDAAGNLQRIQLHDFDSELKNPHVPIFVDMHAYLLAPMVNDPKGKKSLRCQESNFRKAGIPARHLRFLGDLWASERSVKLGHHRRCRRHNLKFYLLYR